MKEVMYREVTTTPLLEWWHTHHPAMFDLQDYTAEGVRSLWQGFHFYLDHLYQFCKRIEVIGVATERDGEVPICQLRLHNNIVVILKRDWGKWSGCVFSKKTIFLKNIDQVANWDVHPSQKEFTWIPERHWREAHKQHSNVYEFGASSDAKMYTLCFLMRNAFPPTSVRKL